MMTEANAEMKQATASSVEAAVVTAAATVASESSTKRKFVDDVGRHHHQRHQQQSAKKRRKKNMNGKSYRNSGKNKNNWIENCSETIHRIPKNCQAPLTCVITRVEVDEEPILEEKGGSEDNVAFGDAINARWDEPAVDKCTTMGDDDGNLEKKAGVVVADDTPTPTNAKQSIRKSSNIAKPSESFFSWYVREKEVSLKGAVSSTTPHNDERKEAKKLFIPVKRHGSVIGPTKVRSNLNLRNSLCYIMMSFSSICVQSTHTVAYLAFFCKKVAGTKTPNDRKQ
jgi:hypothetical protein